MIFLFLFGVNVAFSQSKEISIWHVGNKCINFNTSPSTVSETISPFLGMLNGTEICDSKGNLQYFYSIVDSNLYDKNLKKLLHGDNVICSGGVFIPIPNSKKYYLIDGKYYTIIDTELNNGVGDIAVKNFVWNNSSGTIFTIHHVNCKDYWLIQRRDSALFSYLITEKGITTQPIITKDLNINNWGTISYSGQYAMFDGAGEILIYGIFNRSTGKFEQTASYTYSMYTQGTGISFSPNNTKLYYTLNRPSGNISDFVQVNILNGIPDFEHQIILDSRKYGSLVTMGRMQCGLDGKLYKCYDFYKKIDIVHQPNELGTACNFESGAISLNVLRSDLPNFCSSFFSSDCNTLEIQCTNLCLNQGTFFTLSNTNSIQSALWNFGDGSTSTDLNPSHTYVNSGTYKVEVLVNYADGTSQTLTKSITIQGKPSKITILHD